MDFHKEGDDIILLLLVANQTGGWGETLPPIGIFYFKTYMGLICFQIFKYFLKYFFKKVELVFAVSERFHDRVLFLLRVVFWKNGCILENICCFRV